MIRLTFCEQDHTTGSHTELAKELSAPDKDMLSSTAYKRLNWMAASVIFIFTTVRVSINTATGGVAPAAVSARGFLAEYPAGSLS